MPQQATLEQVAKSLKPIRDLFVNQVLSRLEDGLVRKPSDNALRHAYVLKLSDLSTLETERDTEFEHLDTTTQATYLYFADVFIKHLSENSNGVEIVHPKEAEKTQYVLVEYTADYADEFDVGGWAIYTQEEWDKFTADVVAAFERGRIFTHHFGTNQEVEFQYASQLLECYQLKSITANEAAVLRKLIINDGYHPHNNFWVPEELSVDLEHPEWLNKEE